MEPFFSIARGFNVYLRESQTPTPLDEREEHAHAVDACVPLVCWPDVCRVIGAGDMHHPVIG